MSWFRSKPKRDSWIRLSRTWVKESSIYEIYIKEVEGKYYIEGTLFFTPSDAPDKRGVHAFETFEEAYEFVEKQLKEG